jgi:hypothetical protein
MGLSEDKFVVERDHSVMAELEAVRSGRAVIQIEKKKYFKDNVWRVDRRIDVTVVPQ